MSLLGNSMKSKTAPMSLSIRVLTSVVIIMMIILFIYAIYDHGNLIPALLLFIITFFCWVFAPSSYEIKDKKLIIHLNGLKKEYGTIKSISKLDRPISYLGIRLFGNGGLFCGAGIFWAKSMGIFRAYVTRVSYKDMILVETEKYKILITPEDPEKFLKEAKK